MTEEFKQYERSIKKQHSFGWTPKYEESFHTDLNETVFLSIAKEAIEKLDWDVVYQDEYVIEAKKRATGFDWGQKITVKYQLNKVTVNSKCLGNEMWDFGRNSKRVKLFIYAFATLEKGYDKAALITLEEEVNSANNWEDYVIPEVLPKPKKQVEPKFWLPIIGGIILALLLGLLVAFLTVKFSYVIGVYEIGVGFLIGIGFKYLIQLSNYTNFNKLSYILLGVVITTYILNQYFLYGFIMNENNIEPIGFINFIQLRLEEGLLLKSMNTGWIGLVISWIIQLVLTYGFAYFQLTSILTQYQLEKVPMEVVNFAFYHFVKGKDEEEVRQELAKMGWSKRVDQDDVFASIGAIQEMEEINRMG